MKKRNILEEQIAYYRSRAPEYDDWVLRRGCFNLGTDGNRQWHTETEKVRRALRRANPGGSILELACGTGWWTQQLVVYCRKLTAVDSSPEVIALSRAKVDDDRVEYIEADIFAWEPESLFDFVFFGFWLSHVPDSHMERFFGLVERSLRAGGRIFFVDTLNPSPLDRVPSTEENTALRRLRDGREYEIVKVYHDPDELEGQLRERGWRGEVRATDHFFLYGRFECV